MKSSKGIKCPRKGCNNEATVSKVYGILPCPECIAKDARLIRIRRSPEFYSIHKLHRVQKARDQHGKDILQPFAGDDINPDFFKAYPSEVKQYGVEKELKKL